MFRSTTKILNQLQQPLIRTIVSGPSDQSRYTKQAKAHLEYLQKASDLIDVKRIVDSKLRAGKMNKTKHNNMMTGIAAMAKKNEDNKKKIIAELQQIDHASKRLKPK